MNNFEKLQSLSIDLFAEWLDKNGMWDNSPWSTWWNDNFCAKCEYVTAYVPDWDRECDFAWCELEHKCRYFADHEEVPDCKEIIKMWLESKAEDA